MSISICPALSCVKLFLAIASSALSSQLHCVHVQPFNSARKCLLCVIYLSKFVLVIIYPYNSGSPLKCIDIIGPHRRTVLSQNLIANFDYCGVILHLYSTVFIHVCTNYFCRLFRLVKE